MTDTDDSGGTPSPFEWTAEGLVLGRTRRVEFGRGGLKYSDRSRHLEFPYGRITELSFEISMSGKAGGRLLRAWRLFLAVAAPAPVDIDDGWSRFSIYLIDPLQKHELRVDIPPSPKWQRTALEALVSGQRLDPLSLLADRAYVERRLDAKSPGHG